jgi:hypothetical protein
MIEYIMSPDRINGIPVCSRQKCKCFVSTIVSGWGIHNKCIKWDQDKYGKESHFSLVKKTVCRPYIEEELEKDYRKEYEKRHGKD